MRSSETALRIAAAGLALAGAIVGLLLELEWLPVPVALLGLWFARRAWHKSDVSARPMTLVLLIALTGTLAAGASAIWLGSQQVSHLPLRVQLRVQSKQGGLKNQFETAFSRSVLGQITDAGAPSDLPPTRADGGP